MRIPIIGPLLPQVVISSATTLSPIPLASCAASAIASPTIFGAKILSLQADLVANFSSTIPFTYNPNHPTIVVKNVSFCNITVTYTHPGQNDTINVETWLPLDTWNGRLQAIGGNGWVAGRWMATYMGMKAAIGEGYATISTDAGLGTGSSTDPSPWALRSPGNVDLYLLQNLASVSLNDEALIGKALIRSFYGQPPQYSYWSGCSQGGRQGLMLAQRYPDAYDGIVASAPAINWPEFIATAIWPALVMKWIDEAPHPCELDMLMTAGLAACDATDGVIDGVVTDAAACKFDPFELVGTSFNCSDAGKEMVLSKTAAVIANATWSGPFSTVGKPLWYGVNVGSDLTGNSYGFGVGLANTICNGSCAPAHFALATAWNQLFIKKDPTFDTLRLTHREFDQMVHASVQQFTSIVGTNDPDLSEFRDRGGKMLTFHGLIDGVIPNKGTEQYYNAVAETTSNVHSFYRYFEAPGIAHCIGGPGGQPTTIFDAMRGWVENGTAPDTLPVVFNDTNGQVNRRILCPYPERAKFNTSCGDSTAADCFLCS